MYAQNEDIAAGLFAALNNPLGVSEELKREKSLLCMTLHFPGQEDPEVYCARDCYEKESYQESFWINQEEITFHAYLVLTQRKHAYDYRKLLGEAYIKAIRGPINHIHLLAVGCINEKNIGEFLKAGADGSGRVQR